MDRTAFFAAVRRAPFVGNLFQRQVTGLAAILDAWDAAGGGDIRHFAYILATAFHETGRTMEPIREYGRGKGRDYGKPGKHGGQVAYGRGYVQITWDANYEKADRALGLGGALLADFELALRPDIAAAIMFRGMLEGWFTGKTLSRYINERGCDYLNARRVVNGTDRAALIAGYAEAFEVALKAAKTIEAPPAARASKPVVAQPGGLAAAIRFLLSLIGWKS